MTTELRQANRQNTLCQLMPENVQVTRRQLQAACCGVLFVSCACLSVRIDVSWQVVFMPGWSAFAESAEAAVGVEALGLVWPGTEPKASTTLEKIGFKRICRSDSNTLFFPAVEFSVAPANLFVLAPLKSAFLGADSEYLNVAR